MNPFNKNVTATVPVIVIVAVTVVVLVIFVAGQGDLSARVTALAESQTLLAESQQKLGSAVSDLAISQSLLADGQITHSNVLQALEALSVEQQQINRDFQQLSKAFNQHNIAALKEQLIGLCSGNQVTARQRYELEKKANPGKSENWYFKQAIASLMPGSSSEA